MLWQIFQAREWRRSSKAVFLWCVDRQSSGFIMGLLKGRKTGFLKRAVYFVTPIVVSALFYYLSLNQISLLQLTLAIILLIVPWSYYLKWKEHREPGLPIFAIISLMNWIYYALSLFWGARTVSGIDTPSEAHVSDETITL